MRQTILSDMSLDPNKQLRFQLNNNHQEGPNRPRPTPTDRQIAAEAERREMEAAVQKEEHTRKRAMKQEPMDEEPKTADSLFANFVEDDEKMFSAVPLHTEFAVCFTGLDGDNADQLAKVFCSIENITSLFQRILFLGGKTVRSVEECTHLVVPNARRTVRLMEALALGKNIVGVNWVLVSYENQMWMGRPELALHGEKIVDSLDFIIRDDEIESKFGFNMRSSLLRSRQRKIFEVTPSS